MATMDPEKSAFLESQNVVDIESALSSDNDARDTNLRSRLSRTYTSSSRKALFIALSWIILINILLLNYPLGLINTSNLRWGCAHHHSSSSPSTPPNDDAPIVIYKISHSHIEVYQPSPVQDAQITPVAVVNVIEKRQDFQSAPPPLTTPNTEQPTAAPTSIPAADPSSIPEPTSQPVPKSVLPLALGVGIGAGLAVLAIGAAIAYLVIRKKKIARRESMHFGVKNLGAVEMVDDGEAADSRRPAPHREESRRVDRSEDGNVVGKPKAKGPKVEERQVRFGSD